VGLTYEIYNEGLKYLTFVRDHKKGGDGILKLVSFHTFPPNYSVHHPYMMSALEEAISGTYTKVDFRQKENSRKKKATA
jgi:hypothetical protein